ncbi:unnamed protein product, partial [Discosporangium mesarthrocarpum]
MDREFKVPEDVTDVSSLEVPSRNDDRFCASRDCPDLRDEDESTLHDLLDGLEANLAADPDAEALAEQENFDVLFSFTRDFMCLRSKVKGRVLKVLQEELRRIVPRLGGEDSLGTTSGRRWNPRSSHAGAGDHVEGEEQGQAPLPLRNAFKMAVYLLFSVSSSSEGAYANAKESEARKKKGATAG